MSMGMLVPAAFSPTQVYVPSLASVALGIFTSEINLFSSPAGVKISIPDPEVSGLPSLNHEMTGVGIPLISHSTSSASPTIVFGVELKLVMNGSAVGRGVR